MKRATSVVHRKRGEWTDFNPRPREEGDFILHLKLLMFCFISIHALVKRATVAITSIDMSILHFNPRPREEGDYPNHRQGNLCLYFNPRPREEGDQFRVA